MPRGQAPFPKKKNVDAGKADKAVATRGGYKRTDETEGLTRTITYGGKGGATRSKAAGPAPSKKQEAESKARKKGLDDYVAKQRAKKKK